MPTMICRACLRAFPRPIFQQPRRYLTTSPHLSNTPALSTPASSQPLSAPFTPTGSPLVKAAAADAARKKPAVLVRSSVPAGMPLKGLNFEKNKQDPVALPDEEYPEWLWGILAKGKEEVGGEGGMGDLFSKSKKQRRVAAKRLRKEQSMNPELLVPKVPLYEQTIDLPRGDGSLGGAREAKQRREELTKAMRGKRKEGIKEGNFLKAMG